MGELFLENNILDKATVVFKKAIQIKPGFAFTYYDLGTCYYRQGLLTEAMVELNEAIKLQSNHAPFNRGLLYKLMDRQNEAEENFQKAILLDPQDKQRINSEMAR